MHEKAKSLYEGLRTAVEEKCTVERMMEPRIVAGKSDSKNGYSIVRTKVNEVKVVICVQGTWMLIDITAVKEVIRSVMRVIHEWCTTMLGDSRLTEVPDFANGAISFA